MVATNQLSSFRLLLCSPIISQAIVNFTWECSICLIWNVASFTYVGLKSCTSVDQIPEIREFLVGGRYL
jgi:hypothetical protein